MWPRLNTIFLITRYSACSTIHRRFGMLIRDRGCTPYPRNPKSLSLHGAPTPTQEVTLKRPPHPGTTSETSTATSIPLIMCFSTSDSKSKATSTKRLGLITVRFTSLTSAENKKHKIKIKLLCDKQPREWMQNGGQTEGERIPK